MVKTKPFYITTTLPYANGMPHIGHTVEFIRADTLARFKRLQGIDVFLNTGIDEHGKKNMEKAQEYGVTPQEYVDSMAAKWQEFCKLIEMKYDFFSRTTAPHHKKAVQEFWQLCDNGGYIYKAKYTAKYCVGCEMEKTDSELTESGDCPDHPGKEIEHIDEENYFFKYSEFEQDLLELYNIEPSFIVPSFRRTEVKNFVEGGLRDFSISRLKTKMPWGIPVPGDEEHVIYVWFDALPNYISCLGWGGSDDSNFCKYWQEGTVVQFCGKDNLRPQTAMWQAMLSAAGIKNSDKVFVGGHILSGGQKMSKTVGNVVDPFEYMDKYGVEALRYFLIRHIHPTQDADMTEERFKDVYTADLVNGLGNLVARVMKMAETHLESPGRQGSPGDITELDAEFVEALDNFEFNKAADIVWSWIGEVDEQITKEEPFKVVKEDKERAQDMIRGYIEQLSKIAKHLEPIMPKTAEIIKEAILANKKPDNMFGRLT